MDYRSENNRRGLKSNSLILSCFALLSAKVSEAADRSALCRAITSSGKIDKLLSSGIFAGFFNKIKPYSNILRPAKRTFSKATQSSRILTAVKKIISVLLCKPVCTFGAFFFFLGLLSSGVLVLGKLGILPITPQYNEIVFCALMAVSGLPMLFSRKRLVDTLERSVLFRRTAIELLGFETQKLHIDGSGKGDVFLVFLISIIISALSLVVPVSKIIFYAILLLTFAFVLINPEVGALAIVILLPLVSKYAVNVLMIVVEIGYLFKVLLGKRNFRLMTVDVFLLMYMLYRLVLAMCGAGSAEFSLVIVGYFVVRNLLTSEDMHRRFLRCGTAGATLAAVFAVAIKLCSMFGWTKHISYLTGSTALYNSGDIGVYLIVMLPITFAGVFGGANKRLQFGSFLATVIMLGSIVWLCDSSTWVLAATPIIIFALLAFRAKIIWAVFAAFALPLLYTIGEKMSVSALPGGNFYSLILTQSGIVGLISFAIAALLLVQAVFAGKRDAAGSHLRYVVCGCGSMVITSLLMGFRYAGSGSIDVQILFWMSAGCLVSCQKLLERMAAFDEEYQ